MTRQEKFNFIPASQVNNVAMEKGGVYVSVMGSGSCLNFMKNEETESYVGKYIKFYIDEKKRTLAWRFFTEGSNLSSLEDMVQIKKLNAGKYEMIRAYLGANIIRTLNVGKKTYSKLRVQKYKPASLLDTGEYHYVTLVDKK